MHETQPEYIERKKVSDVCYAIYEETVREGKSMTAEEIRQLMLRFEKAIKSVPAADVEPARDIAHWLEVHLTHKTTEYKCSKCGHWEKCKEPYCICGARMDLTIVEKLDWRMQPTNHH